MNIREKNSPLLIFLFTVIFLLLLSLIPKDAKIVGISVKPVDLFMDVKPDSLLD